MHPLSTDAVKSPRRRRQGEPGAASPARARRRHGPPGRGQPPPGHRSPRQSTGFQPSRIKPGGDHRQKHSIKIETERHGGHGDSPQGSCTMPSPMNTAPHTGRVMVLNRVNQNTNKCFDSGGRPRPMRAGPATDTQITKAAVVGTSTPRLRQASVAGVLFCPSSPGLPMGNKSKAPGQV